MKKSGSSFVLLLAGPLVGSAIGALLASRERRGVGALFGGLVGTGAGLLACSESALTIPGTPDGGVRPDLLGCVSSLANVGTGDFTIRFVLRAVRDPNFQQTLLYQRSTCDPIGSFWDAYLGFFGEIVFEVGSPSETFRGTSNIIRDANPHRIEVRRRGGRVSILIDGETTVTAPSVASIGNLPPLEVARDNPCETVMDSKRIPLEGTVSDVCLLTA